MAGGRSRVLFNRPRRFSHDRWSCRVAGGCRRLGARGVSPPASCTWSSTATSSTRATNRSTTTTHSGCRAVCSIVAGIPLMFLAGWWVAGWWRQAHGGRAAWIVWLAYTVIDLAILLAAGMSRGVGLLFVVSFATKLAAVYSVRGSGSHDRPNQTLQQTARACRLSNVRGPSSPRRAIRSSKARRPCKY